MVCYKSADELLYRKAKANEGENIPTFQRQQVYVYRVLHILLFKLISLR